MYPLNANCASTPSRTAPGTLSRTQNHAGIRPWSWVLAAALTGALAPGMAMAQEHDDAWQDTARPWAASNAGHADQSDDSRSAVGATDASSPWDVTLGIGAAMRPTYEGSDEYDVIPAPWVDITYDDWISLGADGLNAYWHAGNLRIGGGITHFDAREDHDSHDILKRGDDRLKGMGHLDGAPAIRAFAAYRWGQVNIGGSVKHALGSSSKNDMQVEGTVVKIGASIPFRVTNKLTLTAALGATWADEKYTQALFGVTPEQAERSGFAPFKAESGLKSVGVAFGASYQFNEHWSFMTLVHGKKLTGDAADSPIVFSDTNTTVITTINYHF